MADKNNLKKLWDGIGEEDFLDESYISECDINEYNIPAMTSFIQNINLFRQLTMEKDGLKPIERRILYTMYEAGAYLTSKNDRKSSRKSSKIVSDTMSLHGHGDATIYSTVVNNGQYWKNAVPWIKPYSNFGNITDGDRYAHMRYTEALVSYYGYMCFFKDLDKDCLEMIPSTIGSDNKDDEEPFALPSRYPNILVNGGFGMASGNLFCIPPFNIDDIIKNTKKLLKNPDITSVYMVPDFPTGCDIVDTDGTIRDFCENGRGKIKLRSTIEIEQLPDKDWALHIKNIPWMVNFAKVKVKLLELTKNGTLHIKTMKDESEQVVLKDKSIRTIMDFVIVIDKSHDPYQFRSKLFRLTQLEKNLSINFNIVTNDLHVATPSLKGLIQMWIDSRREYKRRLYNKSMNKLIARISLLEILVKLTDGANIDTVVKIIRTHSSDEAVEALMKLQKMNSYQATKILDMGLKVFHKNAHDEFKKDLSKCKLRYDEIMEKVHSAKRIDEEINEELDELKEWSLPRQSRLITEETDKQIADTDHIIVVTNGNLIKKLPHKDEVVGKQVSMGSFKQDDFPKHLLMKVNNLETVTFFDMFGRCSAVPVYKIESTASSNPGVPIYDVTKLNGKIITCLNNFNKESIEFIEERAGTKLSIVTLSESGFIKKTPIQEFVGLRNITNMVYTKLRENDFIVYADILMDSANLLVYTKKGAYTFISATDIPSQSKQGTGLSCIRLDDMDACSGLTAIGKKDTHLIVITEKGLVKRCETEYLGDAGKRKVASYLSSLEAKDSVIWVGSVRKEQKLCVFTRTEYVEIDIDSIPVVTRKAKGKKMINVPLGSNIINIYTK